MIDAYVLSARLFTTCRATSKRHHSNVRMSVWQKIGSIEMGVHRVSWRLSDSAHH